MGHSDTVEALIELGAHVNAQTRHKRNALHYACEEGRTQVVQVLLNAGIDIYARDLDGALAVELATKGGHNASAALVAASMTEPPDGTTKESRKDTQDGEDAANKVYEDEEPMFDCWEEEIEASDDDVGTEDQRADDLARMGGGKDFGAVWGRTRNG